MQQFNLCWMPFSRIEEKVSGDVAEEKECVLVQYQECSELTVSAVVLLMANSRLGVYQCLSWRMPSAQVK